MRALGASCVLVRGLWVGSCMAPGWGCWPERPSHDWKPGRLSNSPSSGEKTGLGMELVTTTPPWGSVRDVPVVQGSGASVGKRTHTETVTPPSSTGQKLLGSGPSPSSPCASRHWLLFCVLIPSFTNPVRVGDGPSEFCGLILRIHQT